MPTKTFGTCLFEPTTWKSNLQAIVALLDHYRLGPILGEGAFGVVAVCGSNAFVCFASTVILVICTSGHEIVTGGQFAVKMVDKVETPCLVMSGGQGWGPSLFRFGAGMHHHFGTILVGSSGCVLLTNVNNLERMICKTPIFFQSKNAEVC